MFLTCLKTSQCVENKWKNAGLFAALENSIEAATFAGLLKSLHPRKEMREEFLS
jgi:hypothetical protein